MCGGGEQIFHHVFFLGFHSRYAPAAAMLRLIGAGGLAFDISGLCQGENAVFHRDQVFILQPDFTLPDFCSAGVSEFSLPPRLNLL